MRKLSRVSSHHCSYPLAGSLFLLVLVTLFTEATSTDFSSATSIFIEVDSILNLYEVEARDAGGNRIVPTSATLSSTLNSNYPASECIDQVTNSDANMCHTYVPDSDPWLRIDYPAGALTNLNSIVIYNRWGHRDRSSRLPNFLSRRQEQRY